MQSPGASVGPSLRIVGRKRIRRRAHHDRDVHRLSDQVAVRGAQRRRVVHAVLDHRRARAADDGVGHLVGDGVEAHPQHFERDRVDPRHDGRVAFHDCCSRCDEAVRARAGGPARGHDGRRVVLFDDQRAGERRVAERRAPEHPRRERSVLATEMRDPLARRGAAAAHAVPGRRDGRAHAARPELERDDLDPFVAHRVTVSRFVLAMERLGQPFAVARLEGAIGERQQTARRSACDTAGPRSARASRRARRTPPPRGRAPRALPSRAGSSPPRRGRPCRARAAASACRAAGRPRQASPMALKSPGCGGIRMRPMSSASASPAACTGPLPPNATSVKSRGSRPRSIETERIARCMAAFAIRWMPSAASSSEGRAARRRALGAPLGARRVEPQLAADEIAGVEIAEDEVGVRHRRTLAAAAVAGRAGHGPRAFRADAEHAAGIDPGEEPPPAPTSATSIAGMRISGRRP